MAASSAALLRGAIPNTLSCRFCRWEGGLTSRSRLKGQLGVRRWISTLAKLGRRALQVMAMTPPTDGRRPKKVARLLRHGCSAAYSRFSQNNPRSPDFGHKPKKEVIWSGSWSKPRWVKVEVAAMRQGGEQYGAGSHFDVRHGSPSQEYKGYCCDDDSRVLPDDCKLVWMAGLDHTELFVEHQSGERGGTSTVTTACERGQRERVHNYPSGACRNVRTLCNAGQLKEVLHILNQGGIWASSNVYISILKECINIRGLAEGKQVHSHLIQSGLKPNIFLLNTLVNMYAKCGSVWDARQVFNQMPERNMFTWTIMIAGYTKHGCGREALEIYEQMQQEGVMPDRVTFICVLNACGSLGDLDKGREINADIIKTGIAPDIILQTALADMYAKCGSVKGARQVFDNMAKRNVVSWNAMIAGYAQNGCSKEAFETYKKMQREGVTPDKVTFICVLKACASLGALQKGKEVHADIIQTGTASDVILETALADMYAKCKSMKDAHEVFNNMTQRNVVSWSTMIAGYAQRGCCKEAFEIYEQMQQERVTPNSVTFICILNACANLGALDKGKQVHTDIIKAGIAPYINLENALVNMYAKCGSVKDARQVFDSMTDRDVVSWSAMITGYAQHGCGSKALQLFGLMQQEGLMPNGITFISLLTACSHMGLVDEGCHFFNCMSRDYGLTPSVEHFGSIVDLLGRAGRLDEAVDFINKMPIAADASVWGALLGACRVHGDVEVAECAAKGIIKIDPQHARALVLLLNIYAVSSRAKVRKMVEDACLKEKSGRKYIHIDNEVYTVAVDDKLHPQMKTLMLN